MNGYPNLWNGCKKAIKDLEDETCLEFRKRRDKDENYIVFASVPASVGDSVSSSTGMDLRDTTRFMPNYSGYVKGINGKKYDGGAQYIFIKQSDEASEVCFLQG